MKKTIMAIVLCGALLLCMTGCGEKKEDQTTEEHSFYGKVVESDLLYIIVEPNEGEDERKSSDKFRILLKNDDVTYEIGTNVKITYIGIIVESYPAQVGTTKIEIIDN